MSYPTVNEEFTWSEFSPIDNTGIQRSIFKSAYKNLRWTLKPGRDYIVKVSDMANLPGISHREYGNVGAWRIILSYNGLKDGIQDITPGTRLLLPTKASMIAVLNSQVDNDRATIII